MDQLFQIVNNKWVLIGAVVGAILLAVGLTMYFRSATAQTKSVDAPTPDTYEESPPSDAESEDASANQDTEESRPLEDEEQPVTAAPS